MTTISDAATSIPLSAPYPRASMPIAFARFWRKYATFSGRASRSEYWWVVLLSVVATQALNQLQTALNGAGGNTVESTIGQVFVAIVVWAFNVAIFVPTLAILVRRLHDSNHSAHTLWWLFAPPVAFVIFLVFTLQRPNIAGSRFDA
jgi:uncharacterized membrane protein YhaH (DUF805 family)